MTMRSVFVVLVMSVWLVLCGASTQAARAAAAPTTPDASLPSISEKTKGLERRDGFLAMYFDARANKVWLEIPNTMRDVLYEVSLPSGLGSTDIGLGGGARRHRTDDQVVHPRGDGVDVGRADEHAKRVVLFGHAPRAGARLSEVHFAAPPGHNDVIIVAAGASEA
jgi:hypothetical protein